jgi:DNA-binding transcriptional ArsR family regulator
LSILSYLKDGFNPAKIAAKLSIPDSTIQYHLSILKKQGIIRKVGYGTWEILKSPEEEKKTTAGSSRVGTQRHPTSRGSPAVLSQASLTRFTQDAVRGHAFRTRFQIPRDLRNWNNEKRTQYLTTHSIPYKHLKIGGEGQRIIVKDRKVWLLDKSIIIYDTASYFAEAALEAKQTALATHLGIIKHIERLLHTSFLSGSDYKFKVSSQHYALIYNALAKQYNTSGERLEVRTAKGTWFIIDDSYSMDEAETIHPKTAMTDNRKVQNFFNGLKDIPATQGAPSYTPASVLQMIAGVTENQMVFAENMRSHITAIQDLGTGVKDMNALLKSAGGR